MFLQTLAFTASVHGVYVPAPPSPEAQRIALYTLASIVGVLIAGLVACAKELQRDRAERKLAQVRTEEAAATSALAAMARDINSRAA